MLLVLQASYLITYTEAGTITGTAVSLVLATVNTSASIQQSFAVRFVQVISQVLLRVSVGGRI